MGRNSKATGWGASVVWEHEVGLFERFAVLFEDDGDDAAGHADVGDLGGEAGPVVQRGRVSGQSRAAMRTSR